VIEGIIKIPKNKIKMIYNEVYENNLSRAYVLHMLLIYIIYIHIYVQINSKCSLFHRCNVDKTSISF